MTIDVSKDVESTINAAVQCGKFASPGDMVAKLVREYDERTQQRQAATQPMPSNPQGILEMVDELRKQVPPEEFAKLPTDGARQLDHYLYGTPKRPNS